MTIKTEQEQLLARMLAQVPDELDKREGSVIYTTLAPVAQMLAQQNAMLEQMERLLFADTAEGEWLDRTVTDFGLVREEATQAVRRVILTAREGGPLSGCIGLRVAADGLAFVLEEEEEAGSYLARCQTAGTAGNRCGPDILPMDYFTGLGGGRMETEPVIAARDQETDEQLRQRFRQAVSQTPYGGNIADYEQKTLAVEGVGAVAVFGAQVMGAGKVGLVIGDEEGHAASSQLVEQVQTLMGVDGDGIAPVGHTVTVTTGEELEVAVSAALHLRSGESFEVVRPLAEAAVEQYLENISFNEDTIFAARLTSVLLECSSAVADVTEVTIGGKAGNLLLEKTFDHWQLPRCGTVTITQN